MRDIHIDASIASQRLDKFLKRYLPAAGSGFLYAQLRKKNITRNGKKATGKELLAEGDTVQIWFSEETLQAFQGGAGPKGERHIGDAAESGAAPLSAAAILYEDEHVLVMNKPPGMLSQPDGTKEASLVDAMRAYLRHTGALTDAAMRLYQPGVVNRLDRNTSGLVLGAKTLAGARLLSEAVRGRSIHKYYLALVLGEVRTKRHVTAYLQKDAGTNRVRILQEPAAGAAKIETAYEPLAAGILPPPGGDREGAAFGGRTGALAQPVTLLGVELITGKTHQIRAQLAAAGHPLLGDPKYGNSAANARLRRAGLNRQFLHAAALQLPAFPPPLISLGGRRFTAPLPADLTAALAAVKIDAMHEYVN